MAGMGGRVVHQAYRFALDPTPRQERAMLRHAGARRWAFNHGVAVYRHQRTEHIREQAAAAEGGRAAVSVRQPGFRATNNAFNQWKTGRTDRLPAWWTATHPDPAPDWLLEISSMVSLWAIREAHDALSRYFDSAAGVQAGPRTGFPAFASKKDSVVRYKVSGGRSGARLSGSRHIALPIIGPVRTHESTRKLLRRIANGTVVVKNATISQRAGRWYVAFNCEVSAATRIRANSTPRQRAGGTVGVDVGVKVLAALSTGELVPNPRTANQLRARVTQVQRAAARCQKGSSRQRDLYRRLARLKHTEANLRQARLHEFTTRLVRSHDHIVLEDLAIGVMTSSSRGTTEQPGTKVQQKSGLNRAILDASFGELRRQLTYKSSWYGARLTVADRWFPSSKTCSACSWQNPSLALADRLFICGVCGLKLDRDLNAARNLRQLAAAGALPVGEPTTAVTSTAGETENAHLGEKPAPRSSAGVRRVARDRKVVASKPRFGVDEGSRKCVPRSPARSDLRGDASFSPGAP